MATLKQIRGRIRAAKNIQQITKAMKLVAAARLRRATDRVIDARPYAETLKDVMASLASAGDLPSHPLIEKRDAKKSLLIVITSDRGLAGAYNTSIIRKAADFVHISDIPISLYTFGKKGTQYFTRRDFEVVHSGSMSSAGAQFPDAVQMATTVRRLYEKEEVDAVYICFSRFFSAIRQVPSVIQVLPIVPPDNNSAETKQTSYSFEPDAASLLEVLLPRYFLTQIWQALLEATASEFGSRMTAMTSATDSAGKMINTLTLRANRERQASITKEILEVVGGAEALKS